MSHAYALKNSYEYLRENTFNGNGCEANWQKERPDLTYEDYWIYYCIVGHQAYRLYANAHLDDVYGSRT